MKTFPVNAKQRNFQLTTKCRTLDALSILALTARVFVLLTKCWPMLFTGLLCARASDVIPVILVGSTNVVVREITTNTPLTVTVIVPTNITVNVIHVSPPTRPTNNCAGLAAIEAWNNRPLLLRKRSWPEIQAYIKAHKPVLPETTHPTTGWIMNVDQSPGGKFRTIHPDGN